MKTSGNQDGLAHNPDNGKGVDPHPGTETSFQAASPGKLESNFVRDSNILTIIEYKLMGLIFLMLDEIALAQWCNAMGLALIHRTQRSIKLLCPDQTTLSFTILQIFPFSSETKRMGIILRVRSFFVYDL